MRVRGEIAVRDTRQMDASQRISEFRQGDFRAIDALTRRHYPRSASKRMSRNPPFVSAYARELAPHYRHPPARTWEGDAFSIAQMELFYNYNGMDSILAEASQRLVTQHTVVGVWLPDGAGGWAATMLDPWECEVIPHPRKPRSVSSATAFRLRVPRRVDYDSIHYDVIVMERAVTAREASDLGVQPRAQAQAYWESDRSGVYTASGSLPVGRYPIFAGWIGETIPGDFFAPVPEWLYQTQVGLSLAHQSIEFRDRYSAGQMFGFGMADEIQDEMDFGPEGLIATHSGRDRIDVVNVERNFDASAAVQSVQVFEDAVRVAAGLRPASLDTGAVTAEAKYLELWMREESRADITTALERLERSAAASVRVILGWGYDAASTGPLAPATPSVTYSMPKPPHNPLHMAQASRLLYEDGTSSPSETVRIQNPRLTVEESLAIVQERAREYAAIRAMRASDGA